MAFRLPQALQDLDDDSQAIDLLRRYYGPAQGNDDEPQTAPATGAAFDLWDSAGTRDAEANRFTADDLVAVTFLSVSVPARAARPLVVEEADRFNELLVALGPDRDLVDEANPLDGDWVGREVMRELQTLYGIGPTTASKLLARKRPRLRPIWDEVVAAVTDTFREQWEPLRLALRSDERALHNRLLRLRANAGLPAHTSPLRVLDVIAWREGKDLLERG